MAEPPASPPGLFASLKRLRRSILAVGLNRLELALVEAEEGRQRAVEVVLLVIAVAVGGSLALMVGTLTVLLLVEEEHRLAVASGITGVYLLATVGVFWRLRIRLAKWSVFSATIEELKKDRAWLEGGK